MLSPVCAAAAHDGAPDPTCRAPPKFMPPARGLRTSARTGSLAVMSDPRAPSAPLSKLAAALARNYRHLHDQDRALEAERAKLTPNERLLAERRDRIEEEDRARNRATLEAIDAIQTVALAATEAAESRAVEAAAQEARIVGMTDTLLTLTKWLVALAALTLAAAAVTLVATLAG